MGKKKFGGEKVLAKDFFQEASAPGKPSGQQTAWATQPTARAKGGAAGIAKPTVAKPTVATPTVAKPTVARTAARSCLQDAWDSDSTSAIPKSSAAEFRPFADFAKDVAVSRQKQALKGRQQAQSGQSGKFPQTSTWEEALTALCASANANHLADADMETRINVAFGWLLDVGLTGKDLVGRDRMLTAAVLVIKGLCTTKALSEQVQALLGAYLDTQQSMGKISPGRMEVFGLVDALLFGELAQQLDKKNPKRIAICSRLFRRLIKPSTSGQVQDILAIKLECLLVGDTEEALKEVIKVFYVAVESPEEAARRGGALGLMAALKASGGGSAVQKLGLVNFLKNVLSLDGKDALAKRQGGLLLFEHLCPYLGQIFEPYVLLFMPQLLAGCSDSSKAAQMANHAAAEAAVSNVSSKGAGIIMKPVIKSLSDSRWRTQFAAIRLMKALVATLMKDCPKRLATVMPQVVPLLCDAAISTRVEVRNEARDVFHQLSSGIEHPDFRSLAPDLVAALTDPAGGAVAKAVESLLDATYTTTIDAASCVLIGPVLMRALGHTEIDVRCKAAQFTQGLVQLIGEAEDLASHLVCLWPQLKALLSDSAPTARRAAACAVGAVTSAPIKTEELDCATCLIGRMKESEDEVECDGVALALATAVASLKGQGQDSLLAKLTCEDNCLRCLSEFPKVMAGVAGGDTIVLRVLPYLEKALMGPSETTRATGVRGLLAATETLRTYEGCNAVAGCVMNALLFEDAQARAMAAGIAQELFPRLPSASEVRIHLMVAIVFSRADTVTEVRRAAERVWRLIVEAGGHGHGVANKQLQQMQPHLIERITHDLNTGDPRAAARACRAAVDLQKRLPSIRGEMVACFRKLLYSGNPAIQRCCCMGLAEILSIDMQWGIVDLVGGIREALFSEDPAVRNAAAVCACAAPVEDFVDPLLEEFCLTLTSCSMTFEGLQELFNVDARGNVVRALFAAADPDDEVSASATSFCLSAAASAPSNVLSREVASAVSACMKVAIAGDVEGAVMAATKIANKLDTHSLSQAVALATSAMSGPSPAGAAGVLGGFLKPAADVGAPVGDLPVLIQTLLPAMLETVESSGFTKAFRALEKAHTTACLVDEYIEQIHAELSRDHIMVSLDVHDTLMSVLQQALKGTFSQACLAADSMGLLLSRLDTASLQVGVVKDAGPIVRALTRDSIDITLQAALLVPLEELVRRGGTCLRPLVPVLQTILLRLLDGSVELQAAVLQVMTALVSVLPKPETLVQLLCKPPIASARLDAIIAVLGVLGPNPSPEVGKVVRTGMSKVEPELVGGPAVEQVMTALGC